MTWRPLLSPRGLLALLVVALAAATATAADCTPVVTGIQHPGTVRLRNSSAFGEQHGGSISVKTVTVQVELTDGPSEPCPAGTSRVLDVALEVLASDGGAQASVVSETPQPVVAVAGSSAKFKFSVTTDPSSCPGGEGPAPKDQAGVKVPGSLTYRATATTDSGDPDSGSASSDGALLCKPSRSTGALPPGLPTISIASPLDLAIFGADPITVSGQATDADRVTVNGVDATLAAGGFDASIPLPQEGVNLVTATATNVLGSASDAIRVILATTGDTLLTGLVTDGASGEPIEGAAIDVSVGGQVLSATSRPDGTYAVPEIPLGDVWIQISFPDYFTEIFSTTLVEPTILLFDAPLVLVPDVVTLIGNVTSGLTGLPEPDVEVTGLGTGLVTSTDAAGVFAFDEFPIGTQALRLRKPDFFDRYFTLEIEPGSTGAPIEIDLVYPTEEGEELAVGVSPDTGGTVVDQFTSEPLAGATVALEDGTSALTDAAGRFFLDGLVPGQTLLVTASAVGYEEQTLSAFVVVNGEEDLAFGLRPATKGFVGGSVTDAATGAPVVLARVGVTGSRLLVTTTEPDGSYGLVAVPSGVHVLEFSHPEYLPASVGGVAVSDLAEASVDLALNRRPTTGGLTGLVTDAVSGSPVSGAVVSLTGVVSDTTGSDGVYSLAGLPAGLVTLTLEAGGFPPTTRTTAVVADEDPQTPSLTTANFALRADGSAPGATAAVVTAAAGGVVEMPDTRLAAVIVPDALSGDGTITVQNPAAPVSTPGNPLFLDPALGLDGIVAVGREVELLVEPPLEGEPAPDLQGPLVLKLRYSEDALAAAHVAEDSLFPYVFDGTQWTALRTLPHLQTVDRINNVVIVALDPLATETGAPSPIAPAASPAAAAAAGEPGVITKIILALAGVDLDQIPPRTNNVAVVDIANFRGDEIHANALPLLVVHGWDPAAIKGNVPLLLNPLGNRRYGQIIQDLLDGTNGVYRPVFLTYNPRVSIYTNGAILAFRLHDKLLNGGLRGIPSPSDPESGRFPFVNSFGFSMGGLVERTYQCFAGRVSDMISMGTPHHGALQRIVRLADLLTDLREVLEKWSPGTAELLDYDDATGEGNSALFDLNTKLYCSAPQRDLGMIAGNRSSFIEDLVTIGVTPNDGVVPSFSALGKRRSGRRVKTLRRATRLTSVQAFDHYTGGDASQPINAYAAGTIFRILSDWVVSTREIFEVTVPTEDKDGSIEAQVRVEYNTPHRDITHVALVLYVEGGDDKWRIVAGAHPSSFIPTNPEAITGNSLDRGTNNPLQISAMATLPKIVPEEPKTEVKSVRLAVVRLGSAQEPVPETPTGGFGLPD